MPVQHKDSYEIRVIEPSSMKCAYCTFYLLNFQDFNFSLEAQLYLENEKFE